MDKKAQNLKPAPIAAVSPQCNQCRYLEPKTATCSAFPDGIPKEILFNRKDHQNTYPGDYGIRFEEKNR